jgi:hypothetical protein
MLVCVVLCCVLKEVANSSVISSLPLPSSLHLHLHLHPHSHRSFHYHGVLLNILASQYHRLLVFLSQTFPILVPVECLLKVLYGLTEVEDQVEHCMAVQNSQPQLSSGNMFPFQAELTEEYFVVFNLKLWRRGIISMP